jgi:two-component system, OmpR family, copper resistance phosphate regulon response regulator CusR
MRCLLVEDEKRVADFVARGLRTERIVTDVAYDGLEGWRLASTYDYDLIILDLMLPGMTGAEVLQKTRETKPQTPVLILTALEAVHHKVTHFEAGADDYLTKPFALEELLVRAKALIRRGVANRGNVLRLADLELDRLTQQVRRAGRPVDLTAKEYAVLEYMVANARQVLTRNMIVEHVWDETFQGLTNIVEVYVRHLRTKVDDPHAKKLIRTVRGSGYCITDED